MDTREFLERHFADLRDDEVIEIRCVYKDDSQPVRRKYFTDPAEAAKWALAGNAKGYHAFYGVNPRSRPAIDAGARGKEAVARITHVWVDIDCHNDSKQLDQAATSLNRFPLHPEHVVSSGGGYQAIWRVNPYHEAHPDPVAERVMRRIASHLAGDPTVAEIARVLRLPETINHKPEYPPGTTTGVLVANNTRYSIADFELHTPERTVEVPQPLGGPPAYVTFPGDIDPDEFYHALHAIDPWSLSYDEWLRVLMATHAFDPSEKGLSQAEYWGQGKRGEIATKWKSFKRDGSNPATVFHFARAAGWRPTRDSPGPLMDFTDPEAPKPRPRPGITLTPLSDFFDEVDVPPAWVVDDFLHAGGVSLLVAKQKVGKSSWAANLAVAVGSGQPFMGHATKRGLVHVISLEVARDWVRQQYRHLIAAHKLAEPPLIAFHASTGLIDGAWEQIAEAVMRDRPALVVVDTLAKAVPIADGNNYHEVYKALMPVMELAEASGAHIMCVHHTNKGLAEGADAVMGSVAFAASVDLTIMLRRDREANLRSMELEARFLPEQAAVAFDFDEDRRLVLLGDKDELLRRTARDRLLAQVKATPGMTASELKAATGLPDAVAGPALHQLQTSYRVTAEGHPKRFTAVEYTPPTQEVEPQQGELK